MGEVVPLIERVTAAGDWTPVEREGLKALAEQYAAERPELEVVFGRTDTGDPWCVIKDIHDEILVHVARIASRFVLHSVPNDDIAESDDLIEMLRSRIAALDLQLGKVLPFGRAGHVLTALVIVTALHWESLPPEEREPEGGAAHQSDEAAQQAAAAGMDLAVSDAEAPAAVPLQSSAGVSDGASGQAAPQASVTLVEAPTTEAPSDPQEAAPFGVPSAVSPAEASARDLIQLVHAVEGTEAAEQLAGTPGADSIDGRGGADTLRAAGGLGEWDRLNGGEGDDRIELAAHVIGTGGPGADTFVVQAPAATGSTEFALLGVITDFVPGDGDRVVSDRGPVVTWTPDAPPTQTPPDLPATLASSQSYLVVDVDGDGRGDGYLILAQANEAGENTSGAASPSSGPDPVPALPTGEPAPRSELPGMALDATDLW